MAERVGFEPTEGCPSPVFKTGAFDQLSHLSKILILKVFPLAPILGTQGFLLSRKSCAAYPRTFGKSSFYKDLAKYFGVVFRNHSVML